MSLLIPFLISIIILTLSSIKQDNEYVRTLNSINDISSDQSNTVIFAVPIEVLRAIEGMGEMWKNSKKA